MFGGSGAQEKYGVTPDLACVAKIVAGGMAGGAVVGRADLMALFDFNGASPQRNPVARC